MRRTASSSARAAVSVVPAHLGADYWRERADRARAQASTMNDPAAKRALLEIARSYERLAEQAEYVEKTRVPPREDA
jgi:hypothetical protein